MIKNCLLSSLQILTRNSLCSCSPGPRSFSTFSPVFPSKDRFSALWRFIVYLKKKKRKGLANNSSILGISERNITSFLQPDHEKGPISTAAAPPQPAGLSGAEGPERGAEPRGQEAAEDTRQPGPPARPPWAPGASPSATVLLGAAGPAPPGPPRQRGGAAQPRRRHGNATAANRSRGTRRSPPAGEGRGAPPRRRGTLLSAPRN